MSFSSLWASTAVQAVIFSDLNPTGLLPCVAFLFLLLTHTLCSRWWAGCSAPHVTFPRKPEPDSPLPPLPLVACSLCQAPGWCPRGTSLGHGKRVSTFQKMHRQLHPWPIFSAQNLEQLCVFAFVLGLNMCLAISQSYLKCRGVVRLPYLTQPVTSADRWPVSIKLFYLFHFGWFKSWSFKSFVAPLLLA